MSKLILVTGATGYIASRLIPQLLDAGYRVRCMARDPLRLRGRSWFRSVEVVQADVTLPATLGQALQGVHTAYYLIHNMSSGHGYIARELQGAQNFASAAEEAGVEHIIYLGGLADPEQHIAPHMRSRIETGEILRRGRVPVTEFRAGVITGSGSISFEMIRFMTELFPIVPGPVWMKNRSQPIAIQNVIDYLLAALETPEGRGGIFEIGGPDITTYAGLMIRYGQMRGLHRRMLLFRGLPVWFMALGVGWMTPVHRPIASALIAGLATDSIVLHAEALQVFKDIRLISLDDAINAALRETQPQRIERIWSEDAIFKSLKHEGFFIKTDKVELNSISFENALQALQLLYNPSSWRVDMDGENQHILMHKNDLPAGDHWIEWKLLHQGECTTLQRTIFFSPRGLTGFIHWYFQVPFFTHSMHDVEKMLER
jgi:uncharacterized protein YbjT (DUF2867 family)